MAFFPVQTIASAPEQSRAALEQLQKAFGALPNLAGAIGNSPQLANAFAAVFQQVHSGSFSEPEIQIVLLTDAVVNSCAYAVALHTTLALQYDINPSELTAIREDRLPSDPRFAALSKLARALIEKRGHVAEQELQSFLEAGFAKEQILEVICIVAASTITNYAGTIAQPALDEPFQAQAWRS
jgi:uncharacterized peroxidase-related enzyme